MPDYSTQDPKEVREAVWAWEEERLQKRLRDLESLEGTARVLSDVEEERDRQNQRWGGNAHDDLHGPRDWAAFIIEHLGKALDAAEGGEADRYRRRMVEVAALAAAAVEVVDRARPVPAGARETDPGRSEAEPDNPKGVVT